ncbi:protein of unknown function [Moritella yayanosii]|uniref:Uncharacterized protein n=1 Tax=Moritella yayanosii TaxID=69539 RepID=A0A330LTW8_9GAMM|nr:protein of unknown function [Moritella yayanosii]
MSICLVYDVIVRFLIFLFIFDFFKLTLANVIYISIMHPTDTATAAQYAL